MVHSATSSVVRCEPRGARWIPRQPPPANSVTTRSSATHTRIASFHAASSRNWAVIAHRRTSACRSVTCASSATRQISPAVNITTRSIENTETPPSSLSSARQIRRRATTWPTRSVALSSTEERNTLSLFCWTAFPTTKPRARMSTAERFPSSSSDCCPCPSPRITAVSMVNATRFAREHSARRGSRHSPTCMQTTGSTARGSSSANAGARRRSSGSSRPSAGPSRSHSSG